MRSLLNPKGKAVALHLHPEYAAGRQARKEGLPASANPHPFFGSDEEYTSHYAWDIGWQKEKTPGQ
jgi:hypothetical protein